MIRSMCAISRLLPEFVDFGGNELEQLVDQAARLHFGFAAEIDQLAVDARNAMARQRFSSSSRRR